MAWVGGAGGGLYSVDGSGQLFSINVADGTVTTIGTPDTTGGVPGAQFGGTNGLFDSANNGSGFYRINLTTGQKTLMSGAPGSGTNDGANCPNAAITIGPVTPPAPTSVPTLEFAGLGLLGVLSAGMGALALRRRRRAE